MFKLAQKMQASASAAPGGGERQEETGTWHYLVVDPHGIRPRTDSSYSKDTCKEKSRYLEATVVQVSRRKRCGWTTWLACSDGWVFDVSPKDKKVRMVEVEVCSGDFEYRVCDTNVPLLKRPSLTLATKAHLQLDEVVMVKEKVRPVSGRGAFLRLADGRGWVFEMSGGRQVMCRSAADSAPAPAVAVRRLSQALAGESEHTLGEPEIGAWSYIVLDPKGMTLRQSATDSQNTKLDRRIEEGQLVSVVERRTGDGTTFLRLDAASGGGWCFDVAAKKRASGRKVRMMQVDLELGRWNYRICRDKGVAVRSLCSFSDGCRISQGPQRGELVSVTQRVKIGDTTFLYLKEGGWIFDRKGGVQMVQGPFEIDSYQGTATLKESDGAYLRSSPTKEQWAETKMLVLGGAVLQVDRIGIFEGLRWAHVTKPGGHMEGWMPAGTLGEVVQQAGHTSSSPHFSAEQVRAAWFAADPTRTNPRTVEVC